MRITPEILLKIAQDTVNNRVKTDHTMLAAYLQGSLLSEMPLIGNTTDIDLFLVHTDEVEIKREIIRLTDEVHLDIAHHTHKMYHQPRELRLHPWLGSSVYGCKILYDPQHFLDFTQASVRAQFHRPDNIHNRAHLQAVHARQIWMGLSEVSKPIDAAGAIDYLRAIEHAINAIACLNGSPLTERRFLVDFPARATAARHFGLVAGLLGLLGAQAVDTTIFNGWLPEWHAAYIALPVESIPIRLHPHRINYYERAIRQLSESDHPQQALWPFWHTWSHIIANLPVDKHHHSNRVHQAAWLKAGEFLGLLGKSFGEKITALDIYLDQIEEILENWACENGV